MIEQNSGQTESIVGYSNPESVYRGYFEDLKAPVEIVPPDKAKATIESELDEQFSTSNLSNPDKNRIKNITLTCLEKLDQNQILPGHIRGIIKGFVPALTSKQECIKSFFDHGAFMKGFEHEADGISTNDFIFQCLTRKCKPSNFSRLVYRSKKMPAIDSQKILQNRKDGILLNKEVGFYTLRDMIHNQRKIALPVVNSMIEFYETGDDSTLRLETQKWKRMYPEDDINPLLDRSLYNVVFQETRDKSIISLRTIDVLYRLQENLSFVGFEPPVTPNEELNELLEKTSANFSYPSIESLDTYTKPLTLLNSILISAIKAKQIGIDPSFMATTNWLRERISRLLGELSFESIEKLYHENSLKELLRLMELTASSAKYNEDDFESFVSKYQSKESFSDAYEIIVQKVSLRLGHTFKYFKDNASLFYKFGGNLTINEIDNANENIENQLLSLGFLNTHRPTTNKGRDRYHEALGMKQSPN